MTPYLEGIHLTLDSWRDGRDKDGWKVLNNARREFDSDDGQQKTYISTTNMKPPIKVSPVPRLLDDLLALNELFQDESPPWRFVRGSKILIAKYGFGDASKAGFGSTFLGEEGISFRYGTWGRDGQESTSNFRELENLAQALKDLVKNSSGGSEVFIFPDNSTAESAYFKGTSSSKSLFNIVLRLRKLEFRSGIKIHFIHVSGSRMIVQGTDGLSRGDTCEGVMQGHQMLNFVPLHQTAVERSPQVKQWILSWLKPSLLNKEEIIFVNEQDWFWRAYDIVGGKKNADGIWIPE